MPQTFKSAILLLFLLLHLIGNHFIGHCNQDSPTDPPHSFNWLPADSRDESLASRIQPPPGFQRRTTALGSFANWLQHLPLREKNWPVHLFNGQLKSRQDIHEAVIDIDTGHADLQQCADAIIRLRAEYLWNQKAFNLIRFQFLNGFVASYERWRRGYRYVVSPNRVREVRVTAPDPSYACFRQYLQQVFQYANTTSLSRELEPVTDITQLAIGDVFVCTKSGGGICHAVLVVDMAVNDQGDRVFLLAQSFMPAQEIHVLKNPSSDSAWFDTRFGQHLITPEWTFAQTDLKRFR